MKIKVINKGNCDLPKYESDQASGMDLQANIDESITLQPLERYLVPTGLHLQIPVGYEVQIRARSGLAIKSGISLVNGVGTIDSDYRGEIKVILVNLSDEPYIIRPKTRIAQMVVNKYETATLELVEELDETERGDGGFGHTGK